MLTSHTSLRAAPRGSHRAAASSVATCSVSRRQASVGLLSAAALLLGGSAKKAQAVSLWGIDVCFLARAPAAQ
jgi:hypothetical protein